MAKVYQDLINKKAKERISKFEDKSIENTQLTYRGEKEENKNNRTLKNCGWYQVALYTYNCHPRGVKEEKQGKNNIWGENSWEFSKNNERF